MKNQLTTNQQNAMNIFDDVIITNSDWAEEGWDRVYISRLVDTLVDNGWSNKSAEGTVGSLCETEHLTAEDSGSYILWL
jgi:hypothetical protein